ncbi:MAG: helicase-related protein [Gammaproteobacteria bacterium]|nr:helicase-related protein [Gammaproteobacteria bacterium]
MVQKANSSSLSKQLELQTEENLRPLLSNAIVDNRCRKVGQYLRDSIQPEDNLSIVSAYFTIYAYEALKDKLDEVKKVRFLYGEPSATSTVDPEGQEFNFFHLTEDVDIALSQQLSQKKIAQDCIDWIRDKVEIRSIKRSNFLHGKLYHIKSTNGSDAIMGSSNFTKSGLGFGARPNIELNMKVGVPEDREALLDWFNELWDDKISTKDVKQEVIDALNRLLQPSSPEFIYYKSLFHIFKDRLDRHEEAKESLDGIRLRDTEIWKRLYSFQQHGATSAIGRLLTYNGCILADSVGLGKTWTALTVIKYFELYHNVNVLVLCPKRLVNNWTRYLSQTAQTSNPFLADRFNYTVLAHTDLSRYEGTAGQTDLKHFNWGVFGLVVIDESHNFRNISRDKKNSDGKVVRFSRYNRLLEEVIKSGGQTKLLLLSATPVNTSLRDLRNQIYLITEKSEDVFNDSLGISNLRNMFKLAQQAFEEWQKNQQKDKSGLLDSLGGDLLVLLDAITLARSRSHITKYYEKDMEAIGRFPWRLPPQNFAPGTDSEGKFSYEELWDRLEEFKLVLYFPSKYLTDSVELAKLDQEKRERNFNQRDRERALIGMMRVNLLKRLESSVEAFRLTTHRILEKINKTIDDIQKYRDDNVNVEELEIEAYEDEEDEEYVVDTKLQYHLRDLDVDAWECELKSDQEMLADLYKKAESVSIDRDAKFAQLKDVLKEKVDRTRSTNGLYKNRKVIVFTAFADTAIYLYEHLEHWVTNSLKLNVALLTGGDNNRSSVGITDYKTILAHFAPEGQLFRLENNEIDLLITTDCISEGQNLQDCDTVINYDIHWNPVRLIQRFGRIDRLGSQNETITMVNFWPSQKLEDYLNLKYRVEARAALADICATGVDDLLQASDSNENSGEAYVDLFYRDKQLQRIREEILDFDELDDNLSMSDFTLDNFVADVLQYLQQNRKTLEEAPFGLYSLVERTELDGLDFQFSSGVLFCLRNLKLEVPQGMQQLHPYFLIYVSQDGSVLTSSRQAKRCLDLFRSLVFETKDCSTTDKQLQDVFNESTRDGKDMSFYSKFLDNALTYLVASFRNQEKQLLKNRRDAAITPKLKLSEGWELITWLVILDKDTAS